MKYFELALLQPALLKCYQRAWFVCRVETLWTGFPDWSGCSEAGWLAMGPGSMCVIAV